MRIDLITPDGRYDKAAILRDAHDHQYGAMRRHGWSWSRCLSFSWARARAMRERAQRAASGEKEGAAFAGGSQRVYGAACARSWIGAPQRPVESANRVARGLMTPI